MTETSAAAGELAALRAEVARLTERVDNLEARLHSFHPEGQLPEDVVLAISAAVAAYLGTRATVKQVRLRRSGVWAAHGRAGHHHSHASLHSVR